MYPETKGRFLEEIDIIFAKGYVESMSYVKAAKQLPYLDNEAIDAKAREYGFTLEEEGETLSKNNEKAEIGSRGFAAGP